jgi:integrase
MTPLRESVLLEMRLRGFSPRTHESYIHALKELARFYLRPLETLACAEVQAFLDHLITVRKLAWATINVYFSAFRFLYTQVLKRNALHFSIPPRGRSRTRPGILSREETFKLIEAPPNLKHRALLSMVYGSGLRVSEVVSVQPVHVDRGRMMLKVTGTPTRSPSATTASVPSTRESSPTPGATATTTTKRRPISSPLKSSPSASATTSCPRAFRKSATTAGSRLPNARPPCRPSGPSSTRPRPSPNLPCLWPNGYCRAPVSISPCALTVAKATFATPAS